MKHLRHFYWGPVLLVVVGTSIAYCQVTSKITLEKILSNPKIWGKDFKTALADVSILQSVGEREVAILPDRVQSTAPNNDKGQVEALVVEFRKALSTVPRETRESVHEVLDCDKEGSPASCRTGFFLNAQTVKAVNEHGETRVAVAAKQLQFLAPDVDISAIKKELGPPEGVTQKVIQTEYERRPEVLTEYHYASGQITFVTSSMQSNTRLDRVYLDANALSRSLSEARKK
jgi:hypothetical protein